MVSGVNQSKVADKQLASNFHYAKYLKYSKNLKVFENKYYLLIQLSIDEKLEIRNELCRIS